MIFNNRKGQVIADFADILAMGIALLLGIAIFMFFSGVRAEETNPELTLSRADIKTDEFLRVLAKTPVDINSQKKPFGIVLADYYELKEKSAKTNSEKELLSYLESRIKSVMKTNEFPEMNGCKYVTTYIERNGVSKSILRFDNFVKVGLNIKCASVMPRMNRLKLPSKSDDYEIYIESMDYSIK